MRGGVPRGGPARGGAVRGAPAGRGGPPAQPGRGAAASRARVAAPGAQRMPPPPRPPAQESYEDYVSVTTVSPKVCSGFIIFKLTQRILFCLLSPTTKATQSPAMNPTTAITVSHRREFEALFYSLIHKNAPLGHPGSPLALGKPGCI